MMENVRANVHVVADGAEDGWNMQSPFCHEYEPLEIVEIQVLLHCFLEVS